VSPRCSSGFDILNYFPPVGFIEPAPGNAHEEQQSDKRAYPGATYVRPVAGAEKPSSPARQIAADRPEPGSESVRQKEQRTGTRAAPPTGVWDFPVGRAARKENKTSPLPESLGGLPGRRFRVDRKHSPLINPWKYKRYSL